MAVAAASGVTRESTETTAAWEEGMVALVALVALGVPAVVAKRVTAGAR